MKFRSTLISLTLASGLALSACAGSTDTPDADPTTAAPTATTSTSTTPGSSAPAEGVTVEISLTDGKFDPQGKTVKVPVDEPVTLAITADAAGALHIHSTPEEQVEFGIGETSKTITFTRPGVIEVESHDTGAIVVMLQVS